VPLPTRPDRVAGAADSRNWGAASLQPGPDGAVSGVLAIRQRTERDPGQAVLWERQAVCRFRAQSTGQHLGTFMGKQQIYWD